MEKKKELIVAGLVCLLVTSLFFYKTVLRGHIPFPGDLIVSEYKPWQSYSYLGYTPGSYPSKAQYFDTIRQLYPWKNFSTTILKQGDIPLWNPHNFSGAPLLANSQSSVFYPPWLLALVLPLPLAWTILVIAQPLLSFFFTYLFAKKIGLSVHAAIFSGCIFGFSLYQTVFLEYNSIGHVIMWLPLALFGFELWREKQTVLSVLCMTIPLTLSGLAGHLQLYFFVLAFFHIFALARIVNGKEKQKTKIIQTLNLLFLTVLSAGLGAIQHLPTAELITGAARVNQPFRQLVDRLLIQPKQLFMLFVPDIFGNPASRNYVLGDSYPGKALYVGFLPLFFVHMAMRSKKTSFFITFFTYFSAFLLVLLVHTPVTEFIYKVGIPLLSTGSPTNALFLFSFSFALLAGFGFDNWKKQHYTFPKYTIFLFISIIAVIWIMKYTQASLQFSTKNMIFSTGLAGAGVLLFIVSSKVKRVWPILIAVVLMVTAADLGYFFHKFNPFVPRELAYPEAAVATWLRENAGYSRYWGYGAATIEANFATQLGLYSPDGYDPLYPRRYGEFIASSRNGELLSEFDNSTRSDAVVASGYGEEDFRDNTYRKKVLNILGVKYIVNRAENGLTEKSLPGESYSQVYAESGWSILENIDALPRAFLADSFKIVTNETFAREFFSDSFNPASTVLLEEHPDFPPITASTKSATIKEYKPNRVVIETMSETPQLLFLSDTFFPGWNVYIGRARAKLLRANHTFRAVSLPAGSYIVTFAYEPESFSGGIKLSMISAGLLVISLIALARKKS